MSRMSRCLRSGDIHKGNLRDFSIVAITEKFRLLEARRLHFARELYGQAPNETELLCVQNRGHSESLGALLVDYRPITRPLRAHPVTRRVK
jgi:hypothetical protein